MKTLKAIWNRWVIISRPIGNFMAQLFLTLFYLVFIWPVGIVYRLFGDSLKIRKSTIKNQKSTFSRWEHPKQNVEEARKQY